MDFTATAKLTSMGLCFRMFLSSKDSYETHKINL